MNINIDRITGRVTPLQSPLTYTIDVVDSFLLSKAVEVTEGTKQKTNEQGQLLYKTDIIVVDEVGETWIETTESKKPTKFERYEKTITVTDEEGNQNSQIVTVKIPVEFEDLDPVMIDNIILKVVNIKDNPEEFTAQEVLEAKYLDILNASNKSNIIADIFLNESDIDLNDINHSANTGVAMLELLPHGQAKTKSISLEIASKDFELLEFDAPKTVDIYISGQRVENGKVSLANTVSTCTIKFVNTSNKKAIIKGYAIAY